MTLDRSNEVSQAAREQRLAAQLRANLHRRKAQARTLAERTASAPPGDDRD